MSHVQSSIVPFDAKSIVSMVRAIVATARPYSRQARIRQVGASLQLAGRDKGRCIKDASFVGRHNSADGAHDYELAYTATSDKVASAIRRAVCAFYTCNRGHFYPTEYVARDGKRVRIDPDKPSSGISVCADVMYAKRTGADVAKLIADNYTIRANPDYANLETRIGAIIDSLAQEQLEDAQLEDARRGTLETLASALARFPLNPTGQPNADGSEIRNRIIDMTETAARGLTDRRAAKMASYDAIREKDTSAASAIKESTIVLLMKRLNCTRERAESLASA